VARCGAATAFFAGDDVNDEPVFASAPEDWLTLRVGREGPHSKARFCLDGPEEMIMLLDHIVALCGTIGPPIMTTHGPAGAEPSRDMRTATRTCHEPETDQDRGSAR